MCVPTSFEFSCIGLAGNLWTPERAPEGRGPLRCSVYVIGIYVYMSPSPSVHPSVSLVSYTPFYKQWFFQLRLECCINFLTSSFVFSLRVAYFYTETTAKQPYLGYLGYLSRFSASECCLEFCIIFTEFQPNVAYKSVAYEKKRIMILE